MIDVEYLKQLLADVINNGRFTCFKCGAVLSIGDISFVDFNSLAIGYDCLRCSNLNGFRSFKSVGLKFESSKITNDDLDQPFVVILNNRIYNAEKAIENRNERISRGLVVEMQNAKPSKKTRNIDITTLGLSESFVAFLKNDMKEMGEEMFWNDITRGASNNGKGIKQFLKECDEDWKKERK